MNFILGLFLALVFSRQLAQTANPILNRFFLGTVLYGLLFFAPVGVYLYYFHTDWSLMYYSVFMNMPVEKLAWFGVLAISLYMLALIIGFQVGFFWIKQDKAKLGWIVLGGLLVLLGGYSLISIDRLGNVGTFAEWQAGQAVPLLKHHLNYIVSLDAVISSVVIILMIRAFKAEPEIAD